MRNLGYVETVERCPYSVIVLEILDPCHNELYVGFLCVPTEKSFEDTSPGSGKLRQAVLAARILYARKHAQYFR